MLGTFRINLGRAAARLPERKETNVKASIELDMTDIALAIFFVQALMQ